MSKRRLKWYILFLWIVAIVLAGASFVIGFLACFAGCSDLQVFLLLLAVPVLWPVAALVLTIILIQRYRKDLQYY